MARTGKGGAHIRTITSLCLVLWAVSGCVSRPAATSSGTTTTAAISSPPPAGAPLRSAKVTPVAGEPAGAGIDLDLIKRGFRARQRNGQLKYCRTQVLTGTHFSNTVCYTADEIHAQDANTKADLDLVNRQGHSPCPNNKCD